MKKVLKWLLYVFLTFTIFFTVMTSISEWVGPISAIVYKINEDKYYEEFFGNEEVLLKEAKNIEENLEKVDYEHPETIYEKAMKEHPRGTTELMWQYSVGRTISNIYVESMLFGLVIGTVLYFLTENKDKKGIKLLIALYIFSLLILGFIEGLDTVVEDGTILDKWQFPENYIVPATVIFIFVAVIRILKQKNIAKKLNEKLKERKAEKDI